ncbi:MAG: isoamylase [Spirochaetaceae bacterium]|nr:isoamylase [Spirochaetaceae bacterium]
MKKLLILATFIAIIGNLEALNLKSYQFIELLLSLDKPSAPVIFEDAVVFTADGINHKKVGVAFAHENFSKIYWFKKILVPIDQTAAFNEKEKVEPERLRDSGMLFYAYEPPEDVRVLEYRIITDGLWSADPSNPFQRTDFNSGLELSVTDAPRFPEYVKVNKDKSVLSLIHTAPSGGAVTVAGDFNGWDPFMYRLREKRSGEYRLDLPLPPGEYHYVIYQNGLQTLDQNNSRKVYGAGGKVVNAVTIE